MALADRLCGTVDGQIPAHFFQALVAEWVRGNITGAQAQAGMQQASGLPLSPSEITEVQNLVATVPTGGTTANQAARALRLLEIDQVILLASSRIAPYDVPANVKTRLGF